MIEHGEKEGTPEPKAEGARGMKDLKEEGGMKAMESMGEEGEAEGWTG